jgi:hypothetical protein
VTDESKFLVTRKGGESSLRRSNLRSGLIARGRLDAAMLGVPEPERIRAEVNRQAGTPAAEWLSKLLSDLKDMHRHVL